MVQAFGDLCREERHDGAMGITSLWLKTLPDLALTAIVERSKTMGQAMAWAGQLVRLRNLMFLNGLVLLMLGIAFATEPGTLQLYDAELAWTAEDASGGWAVFGFARLSGFLCMGYGLLLLATSRVAETVARKSISGVLASINTFGAVYLLGTQIAMWGTTTGWITIATQAFFALGYGFFWTTSAGLSDASLPAKQSR